MTLQSRPDREGSVILRLMKRWEARLVLLLVLASVVNSLLSPHFLNVHNLFDMTFSFMEQGMMALTMAFIIIRSDIDLSVASNLGMSAVVMGATYQAGLNIWVAVVFGLAAGVLGGLLNGFVIARIGVPALVTTLGTMALFRGVAWTILGDLTVKNFPSQFTYLGQGYIPGTLVPFSLVLFLVFALVFGLLLHRTWFGRYVFASGMNAEACRFSGIRVDRLRMTLFVLSGFMAAMAGMVLAARFGSVRSDTGVGLELAVITAVVLGGVDIFGGAGTIVGVVLAVFLLGVVRFGMSLINIPGQIQSIVVGLLLILAIAIPNVSRQIQAASKKPQTREGRALKGRGLLYAALGGVAVIVVVGVVLLQYSGGLATVTQTSGGGSGATGVETVMTEEVAAVVLKPRNTPKPPPPTPMPRPTSTPTVTPTFTPAPEATATLAGAEISGGDVETQIETPTPAPSPTPTDVPRPDVPMVEIPAGPFILGSDKFEPNESPAQEVDLAAFYIDIFETTNAEFAQFVEATGYETQVEKAKAKKTWRTYYTEDKVNHPVVKVSYHDAEAYCQWMGKRVPTEMEWEKASRGTEGDDYPWGSSWDATQVNGKVSGIRGTASVGSFSGGAGTYGVEDMAGNVWEWTSSPFVAYPGSAYEDPFYSTDLRVTRGGGWFDDHKQMRSSNRSALPMDGANDDLGFRCVADSQ